MLSARHVAVLSARPEPPIGIRFELDLVRAALAGAAVIGPEQNMSVMPG